MSIQQLLKSQTKQENWSKLYANELDARSIKADIFEGGGIPIISNGNITSANLSFESGTSGSFFNVYSILTLSDTSTGRWAEIHGSFDIENMLAPVILGTGSTAIVKLSTNINVLYPPVAGGSACGSASSICSSSVGNVYLSSSVEMVKGQFADDIDFLISLPIDISAGPPQKCTIQYTVKFQTALI